MRIIGGIYKGRKILQPRDKNTRPLKDLTKESIFNLIVHSKVFKFHFKDSRILDIFSGTGSFGLECLSRGAAEVTFVENYKPILEILKKNILEIDSKNKCNLLSKEFFKVNFSNLENKFDLIFLDPPYKNNNINDLLSFIEKENVGHKETLFILHINKKSKDKLNYQFKEVENRIYGISKIIFLKLR